MEMDWKQRRTVSILSMILAVLSAAVLIVLGIRYRAARPADVPEPDQSGEAPAEQVDQTALHYYNGSATLSFSLDKDGSWIWADDPDFPLDSNSIVLIINLVENLRYQQTLTPEEDLTGYGLDTPSATLSYTNAGGDVRELTLGKPTTDGGSYYMIENNNFSTLYIISDSLYTAMQKPIYDMMRLPELPSLTEDRLRKIAVQGAAPEPEADAEEPPAAPVLTVTARWSEIGRIAVWSHGSDNVTDSQRLQNLVAHLRTLTIRRCVDYHPSEQALSICGFDSSPARLTVDYAAGGGGEETWSLTLGAAAPDNAGYYAQLGDAADIYLIPQECADALLALASDGL